MPVFAFIGFGALGSSLATGLGRSAASVVRTYTRQPSLNESGLQERLRRTRAHRSSSLQEAVRGATAVLSTVPPGASLEVAEACARCLEQGTYYVDLTAAPVAEKEAAAIAITEAGALYVDAAVLGTVEVSGFEVPIVASGPGAVGWQALVSPEGLKVEAIDAPAGHATLLKLLRSVYMKGRDALIVEMMLAARRYGLEDRVAESIQGPGETVAFAALTERVLCSLALHAGRRADELLASGEVLGAAGIDPIMSRAGAHVLRNVADLELGHAFDGVRPTSGQAVLASIDERSGGFTRRAG
jgi:3-hydroxyisobutyrate dehydrogenase-like beta-hydroxyacid dehydrogenase